MNFIGTGNRLKKNEDLKMNINDPVQAKAHTDIKGVIDAKAIHPGGPVWRVLDMWWLDKDLEEADG